MSNYCKRQGTSAIRGQLYEIKLLSLINFRLARNNNEYFSIETFDLATNIDKIGSFDDVCFKAKLTKDQKPFFVFIQAKHKENVQRLYSYKTEMGKNFKSYLTIRYKFDPKQKDVLFQGNFDETKCLFVMYSNAKNELTDLDKSTFTDTLDKLIGSGGNVKKPIDSAEDEKYLCEIAVKEQMDELAGRLVQYINDEIHFSNMLGDDLMLRYHVIMRQNVLDVSEIQTDGYRLATFRQEFFDNNEEHIMLLRDALYMQVLKKREINKNDIPKFFTQYFEEPSDVTALSKLIGTIITYKNGQLQLIKRTSSTKVYQQKLKEIYVSQFTVNKAIELAAKDILQYTDSTMKSKPKLSKKQSKESLPTGYITSFFSIFSYLSNYLAFFKFGNKKVDEKEIRKIKVPNSFGNRNLTMKDKDRLDHVIKEFGDLLEKSESNDESKYIVVTLNESSETRKGLLRLNGGISSAVGNVIVLDKETKLMKFTDNCKGLEGFAKNLFENLNTRINNLHKYRLNFEGRRFPKLSFEPSLYEEELVRDYLNRLLFFTEQSNEADMGDTLKNEIEVEVSNYINNLEVRSAAIYKRYLEKIQKWWMLHKQAPYLTKRTNMFQTVTDDIRKDRLMSIITFVTNNNKTKYFDYIFKEDAVLVSKLQEQSKTILIAENCELLFAKVVQHLERENKKKDLSNVTNTHKENIVLGNKKNNLGYIFFDLDYILHLSKEDCEALSAEMSSINEKKILIFIYDKMQNSMEMLTNLECIAKVKTKKNKEKKEKPTEEINRKIIVIANKISVDVAIIQNHFTGKANVISDERHSLIDMVGKSQEHILESVKVIFQGKEISLRLIINDESMKYVQGEVLNCVMQRDKIFIGKPICYTQLDELTHIYVDRHVKKAKDDEDIPIETLYSIPDDVVLVTAIPGMGKSTLLTKLSLETKKIYPKDWIIRINLLEYSEEFSRWKKASTSIDLLKSLEFMCRILLREKLGEKHNVEIALTQEDGIVQLEHCSGDHWTEFELKLFLNFYNTQKVIFLFDGFDEICPHYTNEVLDFLNTVKNYPQKHKIWITSRPYDDIKTKLEQQFGKSYEISPLSFADRAMYLAKFWMANFNLKEFDSVQLDHVYDFIEYTSDLVKRELHGFERLLHEIYVNAAVYFICGIKYLHLPLWKYNTSIEMEYFLKEIDYIELYTNEHDNSNGTPLNLYLIADYFKNLIKSTGRENIKWNLDINTFDIYDKYLEMKVKNIWLREKIKMDVYSPGTIMFYEQTLPELIVKHKRIAAYAIFQQLRQKLYSEKELNNEIEIISMGRDKVGLISGVVNGIPQFTHLSFTEHYAVEYICDTLKNESSEQQKYWLDFIFNVVFTRGPFLIVRSIFDYKLKIDQKLMSVLDHNQEFIFNILMNQEKLLSDYIARMHNHLFECIQNLDKLDLESLRDEKIGDFWGLSAALSENLSNIVSFFITIMQKYLNKTHVDGFIDIITKTELLEIARGNGYYDFLTFVFDFVRNNSKSRFNSLITENFRFLPRELNYEEFTSEDIVKRIHDDLVSMYKDLIKKGVNSEN